MVVLIGSEGTINEAEYAQINSIGSEPQAFQPGALAPSVGAGTLAVTLAPGWVRCCGGMAKFPTSTTVSHASASSTRRDYIVAEFNWSNTPTALGTPGNSVLIRVVQGGSSLPNLTQSPGVLWQVPIAQVTVPAGATAIPASNIVDVRTGRTATDPGPTGPAQGIAYQGTIAFGSYLYANQTRQFASCAVPDPGGAYRLLVDAVVTTTESAGGRYDLRCTVGNVNVGASQRSMAQCLGSTILPPYVSPVRTGATTVGLTGTGWANLAPGASGMVQVLQEYSSLRVQVLPA